MKVYKDNNGIMLPVRNDGSSVKRGLLEFDSEEERRSAHKAFQTLINLCYSPFNREIMDVRKKMIYNLAELLLGENDFEELT